MNDEPVHGRDCAYAYSKCKRPCCPCGSGAMFDHYSGESTTPRRRLPRAACPAGHPLGRAGQAARGRREKGELPRRVVVKHSLYRHRAGRGVYSRST